MKLSTLRIIGNGPGGPTDLTSDQPTITFNPPLGYLPVRGEIQISNWRHAGRPTDYRPFVVAAPTLGPTWCRQFEELLSYSAMTLEPLLGCFPSSGLVAVHGALQLAEQVSICRMPLKPSFVRAADMSSRKPLPCAFHNWLGERRIGLSLLREYGPERLRWESLFLEDVSDCGKPSDSHPLMLLSNLFRQASSVQEDEFAGKLERLACIERRAWVRDIDETCLTALERHFFLNRLSSDTPNWWLFSNRLSVPLDNILHRLMLCQLNLMGGLEPNRITVS